MDSAEKTLSVFYDADGTLIDSMPTHMKFLREMNKKFECHLDLPDPHDREACRKIMNSTSMASFVTEAGFSPNLIEKIMYEYTADFNDNHKYHSDIFPGVSELLNSIAEEGARQGIVSANYKQNVDSILKREGIDRIIYPLVDRIELDRDHEGKKSNYLKLYKDIQALFPNEVLYVGDTWHDYESAKEADISFIGVTYGWQFTQEDKDKVDFPLVDSVQELEAEIRKLI